MKNKLRNLSGFKQGPAQSMTREDMERFNIYINRALKKPTIVSNIKPHGIVKDPKIGQQYDEHGWPIFNDPEDLRLLKKPLPVVNAEENKKLTTFNPSEEDKKFYKKLRRRERL